MTAVPAYVATDTYGIRWYIIICHRYPHLTGVNGSTGQPSTPAAPTTGVTQAGMRPVMAHERPDDSPKPRAATGGMDSQ